MKKRENRELRIKGGGGKENREIWELRNIGKLKKIKTIGSYNLFRESSLKLIK